MKKLTLALMGIIGAFAVCANDTYLYWMLDKNAATEMGVDSLSGYLARVKSGETYLNLYTAAPGTENPLNAVSATGAQLAAVVAALGDSTSGSFFVELWNDGGLAGRSQTYTYDTAATYVDTVKFSSNHPMNAFALVGGFRAVPEPSSGLALLVGLSVLALRRKKRE